MKPLDPNQVPHAPRKMHSTLTDQERQVVVLHIPLMKKLVKKYSGYHHDDLLSRFYLIACEIIPAWDSTRATFGALLKRALAGRILNMCRDRERRIAFTSVSDPKDGDGESVLGKVPSNEPDGLYALEAGDTVQACHRSQRRSRLAFASQWRGSLHLDLPMIGQKQIAYLWLSRRPHLQARPLPAAVLARRAGVKVLAMREALEVIG